MTRVGLRLPAHVWKAAFADALQDGYAGERGEIRAATRLIWGDQDGMVPRSEQDAQAAEIRGTRFVVYPGVGRAVHWGAPQSFASDLVTFVEASAM